MKNKVKWDKIAKTYGIFMYFSEALAITCLVLFVLSENLIPAILAVMFTVTATGFHIMLQNYTFHVLIKDNKEVKIG